MTDPPERPSQLAAVAPLVRRVIGARVSDPTTADDLVQETLARLAAVEARLDPTALAPYAVVTARNVVRGMARSEERARQHGHRLLDPRQPETPEQRALVEEDRRAMAAALERLGPVDRESLVAHDAEGTPIAALAQQLGTTPGAVAVRLARARARLRVEYLLVLRRVEPPTSRCRPVLLAISAGDKRQQRRLAVGEHLLACTPCAALSDPLVHRRRPLAALWPFLGLDAVMQWLRRTARRHPAPTAGAGVAVAAAVVWVVVAAGGDDAPRPTLFVHGEGVVALSGKHPMAPYAGMTVEARGANVQSVVEGRGFWVGESPDDRVWVDVHDQTGAPEPLTPGRRVSFEATLSANTATTLEAAGAAGSQGRAQLERQGYHLDVAGDTVQAAAARSTHVTTSGAVR